MPGLLVFVMAAALAADPAAPATTAPAAKPAKDQLICTYESQPDSHFKKRVCATKAERDARAALERDNLIQKQRTFCAGSTC